MDSSTQLNIEIKSVFLLIFQNTKPFNLQTKNETRTLIPNRNVIRKSKLLREICKKLLVQNFNTEQRNLSWSEVRHVIAARIFCPGNLKGRRVRQIDRIGSA